MKIVISRKGVDSGEQSGGMASPILPCGCLCSIPIPYTPSDTRYADIWFGKRTLLQICKDLKSRFSHEFAHLDPDLRPDALALRPKDWRPAFGQSGAAESHLINKGIGAGDLFIFFGWFRSTKINTNGKLAFDPTDAHGRHIVYGWLEVGKLVDMLPLPADLQFLRDHPHVRFFEKETSPNRIYVSSQSGLKAGVFSNESQGMVLTREGGPRSRWLLDEAFESLFLDRDLSYHSNEERWKREGTRIRLQSVGRGQEFVFDSERHAGAYGYFRDRIKAASSTKQSCSHEF